MPRVDAAEKLSRPGASTSATSACPGCSTARSCAARCRTPASSRSTPRAAAAIPGVVAVLTGADLMDIDPLFGPRDQGPARSWRSTACATSGEPVAAVAAVDEATAEAAVAAITVEYEELPVVGTVDEALAPGRAARPRRADPTRALPRAARSPTSATATSATATRSTRATSTASSRRAPIVVEGRLHVPGRLPVRDGDALASIAHAEAGGITLWATCQHPFLVRAEIADLFGLPLSRVRVIVPYLGGGFGSKSYTKMEPVTVALARKAGRPVRIVNRVDESMATTRRHGASITMRTAADATAGCWPATSTSAFDTGAYADNGPRVVATGGDAAPGPYRWSAVRVARRVRPHATPRPPARTGPSAPRTSSGRASSRSTRSPGAPASTRWRCAGATCCGRARMVRPRRQAARRGPRGRRREGRRRARLGRAARPRATGAASRSGCSRPARTRSAARSCASSRTARRSCSSARPRSARASARSSRRSRPRCWGCRRSASAASGTDTQFTPYDRSTGASRSTTLAGLAVQRAAQARPRRPARHRPLDLAGRARRRDRAARAARPGHGDDSRTLRRSSSRSASGCPAGSSSGRAASTRRAPARTRRARSSGRSASRPPRSASTAAPGG